MATRQNGRTLPKFGEWNGSNGGASTANVGYTVIFDRAREDKSKNTHPLPSSSTQPNQTNCKSTKTNCRTGHKSSRTNHQIQTHKSSGKTSWFCFR